MANYYNEFDPAAAEWLRELIRAGLIPDGEVDERDIRQVQATDLRRFTQCHFFAGIGGWVEALRLAGWPADRPVWTGSPPCQAFSSAGKRKGFADERDLWPAFWSLIRECRPEFVFGEEVEGAIRHGWLDRVHRDVEGEGYACGSVVCGAHSVGAPHIRQRLYFVLRRTTTSGVGQANATGSGRPTQWSRGVGSGDEREVGVHGGVGVSGVGAVADAGRLGIRPVGRQLGGPAGGVGGEVREQRVRDDAGDGGHARGVEHPASDGRGERWAESGGWGAASGRGDGRVADADGEREGAVGRVLGRPHESESDGSVVRVADDHGAGCESTGDGGAVGKGGGSGPQAICPVRDGGVGGPSRVVGVAHDAGLEGDEPALRQRGDRLVPPESGGRTGFWSASDLIHCRDGKWRRIPAGSAEHHVFGVADGVLRRVGGGGTPGGGHGQGSFPLSFQKVEGRAAVLKGVGNAIVPQLAAEFVAAVMDIEHSGQTPG